MKTLKKAAKVLKALLFLPFFLVCPTCGLTREQMQEMGVDLSGQGKE